jgi:hypothetical protein
MVQQQILRRRLEEAERRYELAAAELETALAGGGCVSEARQRKMLARDEYLRLLKSFSDLVLRGISPDSAAGAARHS